MTARYECNLSSQALRKAVEELNEPEDNKLRLEAIDSLRTKFINDVKDISVIRTDDAFILRFLRFRKFNEERALKALKNYHKLRKTWRDVFSLVDNPDLLDDFLDVGSVVPRKQRAKDGSFISIARPGRNFGKNDGINEFIAATILTTEKLLEDEEMQGSFVKKCLITSGECAPLVDLHQFSEIYGVTVIEDLKCFSIGLSLQMTMVARHFMNLMQDALPVRIKSLDVVNEWRAFDVIYAVIRPFMNPKLRKRMQLHGTETDTLHEKIDAEALPPFLGGVGPEQDILWWKSEILNQE